MKLKRPFTIIVIPNQMEYRNIIFLHWADMIKYTDNEHQRELV